MVLFRSAIAPEIACFIGFFGNWPPFLRILQIRPPNAVCLRPALLKCDVVLIVPDAILDGHLPIILGSFLSSILGTFFGPAGETICLYMGVFWVGGCWPGRVFGPLLDRTFVPVFRHFQTRTCSLSYKNSLDVCLPIANKSAHPLRVRSVAK